MDPKLSGPNLFHKRIRFLYTFYRRISYVVHAKGIPSPKTHNNNIQIPAFLCNW